MILAILIVVVIASYPLTRGAFTTSDDIHFDQPDQAVLDARALIAARNAHPEAYGAFTEPLALPPSLRIENLRYAKVHTDHVDLVVARNPDWSIGARIWSKRHRQHHDEPTRYREIFFFRYTHELGESKNNIP